MVPVDGTGRTDGTGSRRGPGWPADDDPGAVTRHGSPPDAPDRRWLRRPAGCPILTRKRAGRACRGLRDRSRRAQLPWMPMRYPEAPRLDLVEDLHGHRVADPYRWLEDADDPRTDRVVRGRRTRSPPRSLRGAPAARARSPTGSEQLVHAGAVGVPVWRGERAFSTRRDPGQEHAVLRVREPDGTERVLVDPIALDPDGTTTLDAWSPSWEGDLLAYQLSTGGDEESRLYVLDVATGEVARRADRPLPLLPRRLAARRRGVLLRPPAGARPGAGRRGAVPPAGLAAPGRAPTRRPTSLVFGEGSDPTTYYGVRHQPRRPLAGRLRLGRHRPARRRLDRRPRRRRRARASSRSASTRRPPPGWPATAGCWLLSDRDAPRWRLAVADPADPATWRRRPGATSSRSSPTRCCPTSPWSTAPDGGAAGAGRARRRRHRPAVGVGRRTAPAGSPTSPGLGAGSISGVSAPPEGGDDRPGSATPTTRPRRRCCAGTPAPTGD